MAKKEKIKKERQPLTPTQRLKVYKVVKWTAFGGEFVSIILPFVLIGIINYNQFFVEYSGVKMSIAGVLTMALMGFVLFVITSKKVKDFYIPLLIIWAVATVIFYLIGQIINEMANIMLAGFFGLCGAFGLDITSKQFDKKATKIKNAIDKAEEELIKQAYIDEKTPIKEEKEEVVEENTTTPKEQPKKRVVFKVKK